jgi:hypothetical protein
MASKIHQMLVGLISRKMRELGFSIVAFDGSDYLFNGQKLKMPPTIIRHRPDIVGYNFETKSVCLGEAKTSGDLFSKRTKEQLLDYASVALISCPIPINVIIGIPKNSEPDLIKLFKELKIMGKDNISYIWLPEELSGDGGEDTI